MRVDVECRTHEQDGSSNVKRERAHVDPDRVVAMFPKSRRVVFDCGSSEPFALVLDDGSFEKLLETFEARCLGVL